MPLSKITNNMQAALTSTEMPAGSVLQVAFGEYHTPGSAAFNNASFAPMTTAQATITPKFSSSKILVHCNGTASGVGTSYEYSWHLKRGSSWIGGNDAGISGNTHASGATGTGTGSGNENVPTLSFHYLDSPATTNATTYILGFQGGETATYYINRGTTSGWANNYNFYNTGGCTITLMEIAQ
tara:strand:+ start:478 stop:1026 length:549 start_codon:yes stop_codon:yes gene_type:complete